MKTSTMITKILLHYNQELKLSEGNIKGQLESTPVIFSLKNYHGFKDRVDMTSDDKKIEPMVFEVYGEIKERDDE